MPASVLVIDDDPLMAEAVGPVLLRNGYKLDYARPKEIDVCQLQDHLPDVVVLRIRSQDDDPFYYSQLAVLLKAPLFLLLDPDHELPNLSGSDATLLPARAVCLIEHGLRIRALLQAVVYPPREQTSFFVDAELAVDLTRQEVWRNGRLVGLTPTEFRLLTPLVRNPSVLLNHDTLLENVWGADHCRGPQALRPYIHSLRRKLEPDPSRPLRIVTFRGEGYAFRRLHER
jgi:two-component system KDP operon response regulator KdpE